MIGTLNDNVNVTMYSIAGAHTCTFTQQDHYGEFSPEQFNVGEGTLRDLRPELAGYRAFETQDHIIASTLRRSEMLPDNGSTPSSNAYPNIVCSLLELPPEPRVRVWKP